MAPWGKRASAIVYVGVVAALAAGAFSDRDATFSWGTEGVAMLLTLPALVVALPAVYVLGAAIWNVTGADNGGPMWPVTVVYTLMFAGVAVANLWILRQVLRRRDIRRSAKTGHTETTT